MFKSKKILSCGLLMLLLTFGLAVPALAASTSSSIPNSVGTASVDAQFLGLAYYSSSVGFNQSLITLDYFAQSDGTIPKSLTGSSSLTLNAQVPIYFVFRIPKELVGATDLTIDFTGFLSASDLGDCVVRVFDCYSRNESQLECYLLDIKPDGFFYSTRSGYLNSQQFTIPASRLAGDLVAVGLYSYSSMVLSTGLSFTDSASSVSLSPSSSIVTGSSSVSSPSLLLSQSGTGRWKFGTSASGYAPSYESAAATYSLFRIWDSGYVTLANVSRLDHAFPNTSISGLKFTGTLDKLSFDTDFKAPSYSGSVLSSTIKSSTSNSVLASAALSVNVAADGGIVDNVAHMTDTLDDMATNLQTITDDFTAREQVGNDIGGTTTDSQISSGTSGMTTGSSSLSDGIAGLPSFASIIAPTSGFIGFLTVPVQQIFAFGNGYLLYIATAMVLLSVVFWIIKRMGGDN